jgi:hypothetical protein
VIRSRVPLTERFFVTSPFALVPRAPRAYDHRNGGQAYLPVEIVEAPPEIRRGTRFLKIQGEFHAGAS